jgi:hypothetical protein
MVKRSALVFLAAVGACAPDGPEIPTVTWAGEHLEYAPQNGAPEPCAGTLPYMDRFVALVADEIGVELEEPLVFVHGPEVETMCDTKGAYGCSLGGGVVFALGVPMEHELVHGVRSGYGYSHAFFEEGTAEAFGDDTFLYSRVLASGDVMEGMDAVGRNRNLPTKWYPEAGRFVAFLHEQYGPEVTTALLLKTNRDSAAGTAVTVIEEATGLSFEEILADYSTEPTCRQKQYRYPLVPCEQPVDLRLRCDGTVELGSVRIDCDDPSTLGPRTEKEGMFRYLTVEVERDGLYVLTAFDQDEAFVPLQIKECALGCDSILTGHLNTDDDPSPAFLREGRYVLKVWRNDDEDPADVVVKVEGLGCR